MANEGNQTWTEIVCILDRSGSMKGLTNDTIGGFNAFVGKQREEEGRARLSLVLFDDRIEVPWKHVDVKEAPVLDDATYFARGSTALLDAMGRTIERVRSRISEMHPSERPEDVIVLVMTDGYENASTEYDLRTVRAMVENRQAEGWEFVFIGADINASQLAESMGMAQGSASRVGKTSRGTSEVYAKMSRSVSARRRKMARPNVDAPLKDDEWL